MVENKIDFIVRKAYTKKKREDLSPRSQYGKMLHYAKYKQHIKGRKDYLEKVSKQCRPVMARFFFDQDSSKNAEIEPPSASTVLNPKMAGGDSSFDSNIL